MTTVQRAYKFRLYPSPEQAETLATWERQLRWLYNLAHEQRLGALNRPRGEQPRIDYYGQSREMTEIVRVDERLRAVVCCARQEVLRDLDKAWQRWRKRLGGRPRFKRRTDSCRIYLSTPKHWEITLGRLELSGMASAVGAIEIRQDRPWPGDAKFSSCHIVRDVEEWYAVFPLEFSIQKPAPAMGAIGINRGAIHAIADSDGRVVDSPSYYARALGRVRLLSRRLSRKLEAAKAEGRKPGAAGAAGTGGAYTKANLYAVSAQIILSPYDTSQRGGISVMAYCTSPKDVLVMGTCGAYEGDPVNFPQPAAFPRSTLLLQSGPLNVVDVTKASGWTCTVIDISASYSLQAYVVCATVP